MKTGKGDNVEEHDPIVTNKVGQVFIWLAVVTLVGFAISTKNLALIIIATISPGIAGIFTSRSRIERKPKGRTEETK